MRFKIRQSDGGLDEKEQRYRAKKRRMGRLATRMLLAYGRTLRFEIHDHCGFLTNKPQRPLIHAVWHNAIFAWPRAYKKHWPERNGAILTSASRDGELVAGAIEELGITPVRGSSSRRGAAALIELKHWIQRGYDIAMTPDGPRGPKHVLQPGLVKLAQNLGAPVLPMRLIYDRPWRLKSWDRFQIPRPFSRVELHIGPYVEVPAVLDDEGFERERQRIETLMREGLDDA